MSRWRGLTAFTFVVVIGGGVAVAEINHHRAEQNAQVLNEMNQSLFPSTTVLGGGPIAPSGPPKNLPPPSARKVPFSEGYASGGWAVLPGSLMTPSARLQHDTLGGVYATARLRNELSTKQSVVIDVWIYQSGKVVADLETAVAIEAKPGATVTAILLQNTGYFQARGTTLGNAPGATYVFTVDKTTRVRSGGG